MMPSFASSALYQFSVCSLLSLTPEPRGSCEKKIENDSTEDTNVELRYES